MKRGLFILALGLAAAVAGFSCFYFVGTASARCLKSGNQPELAWLKQEFSLSDDEFKRVSELHVAYLPDCRSMCRRIDSQNERLQKLLNQATNATPELESALGESARLRSECQKMMLRHFFEVSQTMPPEQGRRYLAWVKEKAFRPDFGMER